MKTLPPYIVIDSTISQNKEILRRIAEPLSFPLSRNDKKMIETIEAKFDQEQNIAGLAAPQIGFSKRVIIFAVPDSEDLKKKRKDVTDIMPKTIWINPSFEPVGNEKQTDIEGCFSVEQVIGPVERFTNISYTAYTINGIRIEGVANGFLARVIQHETDHLNGKLFIDYVQKEHLINKEEFYKKIKQEQEKQLLESK